ncbi:MAG: hypothetical protein FWC57_05330 [Endomicrobia bacterium]|nr:hypothetical protein [Endomicrobiia bacterium]
MKRVIQGEDAAVDTYFSCVCYRQYLTKFIVKCYIVNNQINIFGVKLSIPLDPSASAVGLHLKSTAGNGGKMSSPKQALQAKKQKAKDELEKIGFFKPVRVYVGSATCENAAGAHAVMEIFSTALKNNPNVYLSKKGCVGRCNLEPTVDVLQEGKEPVQYVQVNEDKARQILEKHLKKGEVVSEWVLK